MKYFAVRFVVGCFACLLSVSSAYAHSEAQTNALIQSMLRQSLIRPNFDTRTQSFKTMPRLASSQAEFFTQEDG